MKLFLLTCIMLISSLAYAETCSGKYFLSAINGKNEHMTKESALYYLQGVIDSHDGLFFHLPQDVSGHKARGLVQKFIEKYPERIEEPLSKLTILALQDDYSKPIKKSNREKGVIILRGKTSPEDTKREKAVKFWKDLERLEPAAYRISQSRLFQDWLDNQNEETQRKASELNIDSALHVIALYRKTLNEYEGESPEKPIENLNSNNESRQKLSPLDKEINDNIGIAIKNRINKIKDLKNLQQTYIDILSPKKKKGVRGIHTTTAEQEIARLKYRQEITNKYDEASKRISSLELEIIELKKKYIQR